MAWSVKALKGKRFRRITVAESKCGLLFRGPPHRV
jgi:hypothetical protein